MTEKALMTYAACGLRRLNKAIAKSDGKPKKRTAPRAKRPRKSRASAKQRTLCMWHSPEQLCTNCNGGHVKADGHGFPADHGEREPVRMCGNCFAPITRTQWELEGACKACGKQTAA